MARAEWARSVIVVNERIEIVSIEPLRRITSSEYFVEVYQDTTNAREGHRLLEIKCDSAEHAEQVRESLQETDIETFTALEDL